MRNQNHRGLLPDAEYQKFLALTDHLVQLTGGRFKDLADIVYYWAGHADLASRSSRQRQTNLHYMYRTRITTRRTLK